MPAPTATHPRLGCLIREGQTWYYAFLKGGLYVENLDAGEILAYLHAEEKGEIRSLPIAVVCAELRKLDPNGDWGENVPQHEWDYCREVLWHLRTFGHTEDMDHSAF